MHFSKNVEKGNKDLEYLNKIDKTDLLNIFLDYFQKWVSMFFLELSTIFAKINHSFRLQLQNKSLSIYQYHR